MYVGTYVRVNLPTRAHLTAQALYAERDTRESYSCFPPMTVMRKKANLPRRLASLAVVDCAIVVAV